MALLNSSGEQSAKIYVIDQGHLKLSGSDEGMLTFEDAGLTDLPELRQQVGKKEIDGVLIVRSIDEAELVVFKDP